MRSALLVTSIAIACDAGALSITATIIAIASLPDLRDDHLEAVLGVRPDVKDTTRRYVTRDLTVEVDELGDGTGSLELGTERAFHMRALLYYLFTVPLGTLRWRPNAGNSDDDWDLTSGLHIDHPGEPLGSDATTLRAEWAASRAK